jgi:NifU-like protein involved in Fe-S cluster formation
MDELVARFYRHLCRTGFQYTGSLENPSIFLDTVGEKIRICSHVSHAYMHIYISIINGTIDDIKYLCTCDPTANVVVEILCSLIKGKSISTAEAITPESFYGILGSRDEEFVKKSVGIIELLHRGLERYKSRPGK